MAQAPQGPQAPEQEQPQSEVAGIVSSIHDGLLQLTDIFQQAKLPPQDVQHLGGIVTSFQALIEEISKPQGEEGAPAPEGAMPGPMSEHGNKNARPIP